MGMSTMHKVQGVEGGVEDTLPLIHKCMVKWLYGYPHIFCGGKDQYHILSIVSQVHCQLLL